MKVAIDKVGRLVVPKVLREELGVRGATDLEVTAVDGRLEMTVADVPARIEERDGFPVIATDEPMAPMSVTEVAEAIERVRR
jgi:bifunctional DNA-binding transcriptional regulator/antitoxin component of YhaV-PrlF toxin-antitoxin module